MASPTQDTIDHSVAARRMRATTTSAHTSTAMVSTTTGEYQNGSDW